MHLLKILGVVFAGTIEYELPSGFGKRLILFFRKKKPTQEEYPRKVGVPKGKPL